MNAFEFYVLTFTTWVIRQWKSVTVRFLTPCLLHALLLIARRIDCSMYMATYGMYVGTVRRLPTSLPVPRPGGRNGLDRACTSTTISTDMFLKDIVVQTDTGGRRRSIDGRRPPHGTLDTPTYDKTFQNIPIISRSLQ
jgi:hypothetical protein